MLNLNKSLIPEVFHVPFLVQSIYVQNSTILSMIGFDSKKIWTQTPTNFISFKIADKIIKNVSCGDGFMYALCDDNSVWSKGKNSFGQLGLGDKILRSSFCKIATKKSFKIISISCGSTHVLFLSQDNNVYSCGNNTKGQLGLKSRELEKTKLTLISKLALIYKISSQNCKSFCIDCDGNVFAFGDIFGNKPIKIKDLPPIRYINNDNDKFLRTIFQDIYKDIWVLKYFPNTETIYKVQKFDKRFNGICGNNPNLESKLIKNIVQERKKEYVSLI